MKSCKTNNMEALIKKPSKPIVKWLVIILSIFFIIFLLLIGAAAALAYKYENKIYPGIMIDNVYVGGLTKTQAQNIISGKFKQVYGQGFTFDFENEEKQIENQNNEILSLNLDSLVEKAFNQGHANKIIKKYVKTLVFPIIKKQIPLDYQFDKTLLRQKLQSEFLILEKLPIDAQIALNITNKEQHLYELSFSPPQAGQTFNFSEAIESLESSIKKLENPKMHLARSDAKPKITQEMALSQRATIEDLLLIPEIKFKYKEETWTVTWEDYARWLGLGLNDDEQPAIILNDEMLRGQMEAIAQKINQPAADAKLQIKDSRVTEFQASQKGLALDIENSLEIARQKILKEKSNEIELTVNITEPKISVASTNELGIKELIGSGWSDFSGSPQNRIHNIGVGAASLNGVLIEPGAEFSLMKTLGEVDSQSGYKPELVIKKNATIPEYGGGLCQIGTTVFRAALQTGVKITARRNHSYRVGYYEPAGTDATVYDPWPDVRFINDTENYILIQSKIWGNNLLFEFWGTKDGRKVSFEGQTSVTNVKYLKPTIFNITTPGPAKEIETTELAPGQKKLTEHAHNGADTVFYQYITKTGQEPEKITWSSHYVPWQEVWLVGVDPEQKELEAKLELEKQANEEQAATDADSEEADKQATEPE